MKKRFTEEQIFRILKEAEGGMVARNVCRKHNVSEQTFYRWKAKYAGMCSGPMNPDTHLGEIGRRQGESDEQTTTGIYG